jgi:Flp pilus assembly protein TadB
MAMPNTGGPVVAAGLAAVGVLLLTLAVWMADQATVSATVRLVLQARGDLAGYPGRKATLRSVLRDPIARIASVLGPWAHPLGRLVIRDRLAWLGSTETAEQFLARQILMAGAGATAGALLTVVGGVGPWTGCAVVVGGVLGWWLPWRDLQARCQAARRQLGREALRWADFLTAAVQAGLQLDAAIMRLADELPGLLPATMARAVRESSATREPLDLCLAAAAAYVDEASVSSVVGAIVQARQTGSDLAGPLASLVAALRHERQQALRTAARGRSTLGAMPLILVMLPGVMLPLAYIVLAQLRGIGF